MDLKTLKGIGEKTEEMFNRLGVHNVEELLEFFPRDYELFFAPKSIGEIGYKTFATIRGVFTPGFYSKNTGKVKMTTAIFKDEVGKSIKVVWFNSPYVKNNIETGKIYILRGKINHNLSVIQMEHPHVYSPAEYASKIGQKHPVYSLTKGLSNTVITKAVLEAFESDCYNNLDENDPLPKVLREKYDLVSKSYAVNNLHFPKNDEAFKKSMKRVSFEEIFLFIEAMKRNEKEKKRPSGIMICPDKRTTTFLKALPYELTKAQERVISEINRDLSSGIVMNRLVQGDVGSGKTLVAFSALLNTAYSGFQGAFMAPTEVLASQHYETISNMAEQYGLNVKTALLTGAMSVSEKKKTYAAMKSGEIDIIVGTHALFQEKAEYANLGLVITDEQHRFGLKQREALALKGNLPHMLVMSATPIPRTLALILYGDMDVSIIDELPARRKPIKNAVIDDTYKENSYRFLIKEVQKGHQAYIICPLVEYSEGVDAQNVEDYTKMLKGILPPEITVGMLHGQMTSAKKNEIMQHFSDGSIQVLVSTTVVEVGVDVPNATLMMIEDANRFGLAQLHQLRGRVGRSDAQSYCIFISNNNSKESMERLEVLNHSNDGFEIASKDLNMRGPGEFLGTRQSGALAFNNFDIYRDGELAILAFQAVEDINNGNLKITDSEKLRLEEKTGSLKSGILL